MATANTDINIVVVIVVTSILLICSAVDYPTDDFFFSDEPTVFRIDAHDKMTMEPGEDNRLEVLFEMATEIDPSSVELNGGSGSGSGSGSGCGPEEGSGIGVYTSICT